MATVAPLSPMATLRWSVVQRYLDELAPRTVLELGCGQGGFGSRFAERADYVGIEPDEKSCSVAQSRMTGKRGKVICGTSDLVGADETYDLVCAFEVIEHLEDDTAMLSDWAEHVAPGKHLMVSVPAWPERFSPMDELVGHYRRYTPVQLHDTLSAAGLTEVRTQLYGWPLGFALESVRNRLATKDVAADHDSDGTMESRSARSGRLFQPKAAIGLAVRAGAAPFTVLQRLRPSSGTGLVAVGRRPVA